MNLREGRIGRQEGSSMALIACWICGIFSMNTKAFYENGNASYLSTLLSAMLSLLAALMLFSVMRRRRCENLAMLYRLAFGRTFGALAAGITALSLLYAAGVVLIRLINIQCRYVFSESDAPQVALYFVLTVLLLTWLGLEIIGRTSKLFLKLILFGVVAEILIALPAFETFRLYPLIGCGLPAMLTQSFTGMSRYLPALLCLAVCAKGVQGVPNAASCAALGATGGGLTAGVMELAIGLTYPYDVLASMHSPMYRLTMSVRTGSAYLRTDKLLLFFWSLSGMLTGGFYAYSAALLLSNAFDMRDIRPAVGAAVSVAGALLLLGQMTLPAFDAVIEFLWDTAWIPMLLPPALAALIVLMRKGDAV